MQLGNTLAYYPCLPSTGLLPTVSLSISRQLIAAVELEPFQNFAHVALGLVVKSQYFSAKNPLQSQNIADAKSGKWPFSVPILVKGHFPGLRPSK
jgi:hypothetical protein